MNRYGKTVNCNQSVLPMISRTADVISPEDAKTLDGLFRARVKHTPEAVAYRYFDRQGARWMEITWAGMALEVARWRTALEREPLAPGDRIALSLRNCPEWVMLDQAALAMGLVVVPLYNNDRPESLRYILQDAQAKLLLLEDERRWRELDSAGGALVSLQRVLTLSPLDEGCRDSRLQGVDSWLPESAGDLKVTDHGPEDLATIVYTSGTTGHPKGVRLTHRNILWNAYSGLQSVAVYREDCFLSFLPLSHTLERTVGYYLPMMTGASVAYARSVPELAEDLRTVRPTILISVPRLFARMAERMKKRLAKKTWLTRYLFEATVRVGWIRFEYLQKRRGWDPALCLWPLLDRGIAARIREQFGGRLRLGISGGAALPPGLARTFLSLGIPILQGYGMTESSPVISVNTLENNEPSSVGPPLRDVQVRIGAEEELLVKSPGVTRGYWNNPEATAAMIDQDGWLHTGDKARMEKGRLYITGRIKDIIVMANGEKVPPTDIEVAIALDPLLDQVMIVGEGKPYLSALVVMNEEMRESLGKRLSMDPHTPDFLHDKRVHRLVLGHISRQMRPFPGYARVRRVALLEGPWTIENGLVTPTLKLRRGRILERYQSEVAQLYEGHEAWGPGSGA